MLKKLFAALAILALTAGLSATLTYAQPQNRDDAPKADPPTPKVMPVPYPGGIAWDNVFDAALRLRRIATDSLGQDAYVSEGSRLSNVFQALNTGQMGSKAECGYIYLYFQKQLKRVSATETMSSDREAIRLDWKDLQYTAGVVDGLVAAGSANANVLWFLCDDVRARIATLASVPFARRLKHFEISVEEYKTTLGAVMDSVARYYRLVEEHENSYVVTNPAPGQPAQPRKTPVGENDINIYEHNPRFLLAKAAVNCSGGLLIARIDGEVSLRPASTTDKTPAKWAAAAPGARIDAFSLLQVPAGKTARIVFEDGRVAELAPAIVVVPWEMEFTLTAEKTAEIKTLIEGLGAEDFAARCEAERKLTRIGCIALPQMRAALKTADMESACRLRRIIYAVSVACLS